jgi:hypothetical protein
MRLSIHASMSADKNPIARAPNETGLGNVPALMKAYAVDLLIPVRANACGSRMMVF